MYELVLIFLIAWFPLAVILFAKVPSRRALVWGVLGAIMFLPMGEIQIPVVPFNKNVIVSTGLLIASLLMDPAPLLAFRPRLIDLPMMLLCLSPFASGTANGMPAEQALAAALSATLGWGVPYFLGRAYLTDVYALREMALGIFYGGLIYAPLCVVEMIFSPILHQKIFGFMPQQDFSQAMRMGGYRPMMFMQHGLMVSMFMSCAAVMGIWLWRQKVLKKVRGVPAWIPVAFVAMVAVGCRSAGAVILMLVALGVLFGTRFLRNGILVYLLVLIAPLYIFARTVGGWTGDNAVALATQHLSIEHGASLQVRFDNENVLLERAMQKSVLGWGPDGSYLIKDDSGRITSIPDGLWVIAMGTTGLVGLIALFGALLTPTLFLLKRFPARTWSHPALAAPTALAVFMATYAIDCLMNAMVNPIYVVALGGVAALAVASNPMPRPVGARPRDRTKAGPKRVGNPLKGSATPLGGASGGGVSRLSGIGPMRLGDEI